MQAVLEVESRAEQLERQHRLLLEIESVDRQITGYKLEIKLLKDQKDDLEARLAKVTRELESNQVTLKVE